jgi:hypothetical protein
MDYVPATSWGGRIRIRPDPSKINRLYAVPEPRRILDRAIDDPDLADQDHNRQSVVSLRRSSWHGNNTVNRYVETMLTVIETCRQQRRNAFAFITAAVESHLAHQSVPSLLPRV